MKVISLNDVSQLQQAVLAWYRKNGRHDLPWRNLKKLGVDTPYGVLVSEVMLQQTQVDRVAPKFKAFVHMFPTLESLAYAPTNKVVVLWSGLGYNRRAILLQKAAQTVVAVHEGIVPTNYSDLVALPAVGTYTARAIQAFAFNDSVAVVDTNVERFYELLFFGYSKPSVRDLQDAAQRFVPEGRGQDWNSALMDLMTIIRAIRSPKRQQETLLEELAFVPGWSLPRVSEAPLVRPRQTRFHKSPRYFRGKIIAHLRNEKEHRMTLRKLCDAIKNDELPENISVLDLLVQLRRDELVSFHDPLRPGSIIKLP